MQKHPKDVEKRGKRERERESIGDENSRRLHNLKEIK